MSAGLDIVAIKSFGDLVIALTCIGEATSPMARSSRILLGAHLMPLYSASASTVPVAVIEHDESIVPSFYDLRKNGWGRGLASGWRLRRAIAHAAERPLLFDRLAWRERFMAGGRPAMALPERNNIYFAYAELFGQGEPRTNSKLAGVPRIGIFPGSRLASKNLPLDLVVAVQRAASQAGGEVSLELLEGERPDLERASLGANVVARDFGAMIAAVRACDAIISADSMPAHLAEMAGIPVFVFSPVDNRYWLPLSAFSGDRWALFAERTAGRLGEFLDEMTGRNHGN